jgi:diguanylate cyclase (GGDEF)-like protein
MELRALIRVLVEKWWLVVPAFLMTFGIAVLLTISQPKVYQSTSTYVVKVTSAAGQDILSALGLLSRQTEIAETYAQVAQSRAIRQAAIGALHLNAAQQNDVNLESKVVAGTNLLQLSATATNQKLAQDYCAAVGTALVAYAGTLYPSFDLASLDHAGAAGTPVSPNIPLNLGLGLVVALLLAGGVGFVATILAPPARPKAQVEMLDRESSAYSGAFFMLRLRQEMSRVRRAKSPLAIALVNVNHSGVLDRADVRVRREALGRLAGLLDAHLPIEDLSARLEEDTFALLLPDTNEADAVEMVESLRSRMALPAVGADPSGQALRASPAAGVVEYGGQAITVAELIDQARRALRDAEAVPAGKTQSFSGLSLGAVAPTSKVADRSKRAPTAKEDRPVRDASVS